MLHHHHRRCCRVVGKWPHRMIRIYSILSLSLKCFLMWGHLYKRPLDAMYLSLTVSFKSNLVVECVKLYVGMVFGTFYFTKRKLRF